MVTSKELEKQANRLGPAVISRPEPGNELATGRCDLDVTPWQLVGFKVLDLMQTGCLRMPIVINRHPGSREGRRGNKKDPERNHDSLCSRSCDATNGSDPKRQPVPRIGGLFRGISTSCAPRKLCNNYGFTGSYAETNKIHRYLVPFAFLYPEIKRLRKQSQPHTPLS